MNGLQNFQHAVPASAGPSGRGPQLSRRLRIYLALLAVTVPMDIFGPTQRLFREGGTKPAIPLMVIGSAFILRHHWLDMLLYSPKLWRRVLLLFAWIGLLGTLAFLINIAWSISYWDGSRNPLVAFVSQAAMYAIVAPVLIAHARLFSRNGVALQLLRYVPGAVLLHLFVMGCEATGLLNPLAWPLFLFRPSNMPAGSKPTGLLSEPSYVGAMAGMYGLILLFAMPNPRARYRILGVFTIGVAVWLQGRTLVPVLLAGSLGLAFQVRARIFSVKSVVGAAVLAGLASYVITASAALDIRDNLSSAMRLGSTLLAWNVAKAGYGVFGIGFGQFHYLYRPEYAPWFLSYSGEALDAFSKNAVNRASTYNLFVRFWVEAGILSLVLFFGLVLVLFRHGRKHSQVIYKCGAIMAAASLGFLITQDTYFFPAFVCGGAILASCVNYESGEC